MQFCTQVVFSHPPHLKATQLPTWVQNGLPGHKMAYLGIEWHTLEENFLPGADFSNICSEKKNSAECYLEFQGNFFSAENSNFPKKILGKIFCRISPGIFRGNFFLKNRVLVKLVSRGKRLIAEKVSHTVKVSRGKSYLRKKLVTQ
jgi:hypothetical protein